MTYCKNYCEEEGISTSELNEAQRTLYYIAENMKINKSISEEGYRHFQMAIKALEQTRWIPCAERLPEDGDTYLVTIEYKGEVIGVDAASYSPVDGYIDKHWETFNDWKEDDDSCYHVTAWMPLPEGYNAED